MSLFDVKGKVVLVTGGGSGIGRSISNGFVQAGAKVYIASRNAKTLQVAADEMNQTGPGSCHAIAADLSTYEGVEHLVEQFGKHENHLNVLVNNAGNNWGAPLEDFPDAAWDRVLGLNLKRVFTVTQKLLPYLLKGVKGASSEDGPWDDPARIITIGSVDGIRVPSLETYSYSASKAAVHQLTRVLAKQLGPRGITSNALACGAFQSKMMKATLEAAGDTIVQSIPLARIGSEEDVAGSCIYLASRAGAWVNGAIIPLDGGSLVGGKL